MLSFLIFFMSFARKFNLLECGITLRCLIYSPPLLFTFSLFSDPRTIWTPFIDFQENEVFYELLILYSLLVLFDPNFGKIVHFCKYFSSMFYDNLFLLFQSLYNHCKPFLEFKPPSIHFDPMLISFQNISSPPAPHCLSIPPLIGHLRVGICNIEDCYTGFLLLQETNKR